MIEIFVVVIILLVIIKNHSISGLILILFLLPFHAFIKKLFVFLGSGGEIFSMWKELCIIIVLLKIYWSNRIFYVPKYSNVFIGFFLLYVFVFLLFAENIYSAIPFLRNHFFSLFIFLAFYNVFISYSNFKRLYFYSLISFFVTYLLGFVQLFILKLPLAIFMGRVESIDPSGHIFYTTTSARILGYERMAGIIGGPNGFGVFVALTLLFLFVVRYSSLKFLNENSKINWFSWITILLGISALIFSFSRAGWFLFVGGVFISIYFFRLKKILTFLFFSGFFVLSAILLFNGDSMVNHVIESTFSGEEASSANRLKDFLEGLEEVTRSPIGQGLGTTNNQYPSEVLFFAESATINLVFELGFVGFALWSGMFFFIGFRAYKLSKFFPLSVLSFSIIALTYVASFFTVNTYSMPYILVSWAYVGLGLNSELIKRNQIFDLSKKNAK